MLATDVLDVSALAKNVVLAGAGAETTAGFCESLALARMRIMSPSRTPRSLRMSRDMNDNVSLSIFSCAILTAYVFASVSAILHSRRYANQSNPLNDITCTASVFASFSVDAAAFSCIGEEGVESAVNFSPVIEVMKSKSAWDNLASGTAILTPLALCS
jgi:hypothetical protein